MVERGLVDRPVERTFGPKLRFSCTRCGACCRHVGSGVGLTAIDLERLGRDRRSRIAHPVFLDRLQSDGSSCASLSDADCTVYADRPLVCRLYPFYLGVKNDGTLQVSIDHCPGVDSPGADLVDQSYIEQEVLPALVQDPAYVVSLQKAIVSAKGEFYQFLGKGAREVRLSWAARCVVWARTFAMLEGGLPSTFTPRDRFECLKADLAPAIEETLVNHHEGQMLDGHAVERVWATMSKRLRRVLARSADAQASHRRRLQTEARVTGGTNRGRSVFRTRTGETFEVATSDVLRTREITGPAVMAEMDYLREIVRREFVFSGVLAPRLSFRQEASLLFYASDAVELMANAVSCRVGSQVVGLDEMVLAISEVDAHLLATAQELGGQVEVGRSAFGVGEPTA